jgi:hypothetical protein
MGGGGDTLIEANHLAESSRMEFLKLVKCDLGSNCIPCECRLDTEHHSNHKQRK